MKELIDEIDAQWTKLCDLHQRKKQEVEKVEKELATAKRDLKLLQAMYDAFKEKVREKRFGRPPE